MHDMKYELPPQRLWPLGVQPPLSDISSNEPSFRHSAKDAREVGELDSKIINDSDLCIQIVPTFDLQEFLETKIE